ncbi:unnamed protein product [Porites lobata]|uniref:Uncharacterized protein n=1 Tax=Porites lobata TaxID=104759 RepID=A0ABN8RFK4_9CNID|nr:unnamed protein product [Porites lobata]
MVEIEGKRGRQVPLLLMPDIKEAMKILVKKRQSQHRSKQQNGDDAKKVAQNSKEGMTPLVIFEGQPQAPDDTSLSVERNLLLKANGGYSSAWLDMVEIEGKRGRQVPLLLMPDIKKAMEILVKKRQSQHQSKQQVFLYPPV